MMRALLRGVSLALGSLKCRNQELTGGGCGLIAGISSSRKKRSRWHSLPALRTAGGSRSQ